MSENVEAMVGACVRSRFMVERTNIKDLWLSTSEYATVEWQGRSRYSVVSAWTFGWHFRHYFGWPSDWNSINPSTSLPHRWGRISLPAVCCSVAPMFDPGAPISWSLLRIGGPQSPWTKCYWQRASFPWGRGRKRFDKFGWQRLHHDLSLCGFMW